MAIGKDPVGIPYDSPGWFRREPWGDGPFDAGYMPVKEARALIQECAEEYVAWTQSAPAPDPTKGSGEGSQGGEQYEGEYMETLKHRIDALQDGHWLLIVAPVIEHLITGTLRVGVMKDGTIKVMYEDGTIEECVGDQTFFEKIDADRPSLFALVGYVQDRRLGTNGNI